MFVNVHTKSAKQISQGGFMAKKILIVDDDPHILEVTRFALEKADMETASAEDGAKALEVFERYKPDLIVLDINLPEMDGLDVCREIRKSSDVPVLFLSSRDEEIDRIIGLEIGGDDYVTKPFSPRELVARVNVILKRTKATPAIDEDDVRYQHGNLVLEPAKHCAQLNGKAMTLTATEYGILTAFVRFRHRVLNRDMIVDHAYADNMHVSDRTIDSHIRHIRSKFTALGCESSIETVHGVGYRIGDCL
jgi:two-component system OmpR family response regulator